MPWIRISLGPRRTLDRNALRGARAQQRPAAGNCYRADYWRQLRASALARGWRAGVSRWRRGLSVFVGAAGRALPRFRLGARHVSDFTQRAERSRDSDTGFRPRANLRSANAHISPWRNPQIAGSDLPLEAAKGFGRRELTVERAEFRGNTQEFWEIDDTKAIHNVANQGFLGRDGGHLLRLDRASRCRLRLQSDCAGRAPARRRFWWLGLSDARALAQCSGDHCRAMEHGARNESRLNCDARPNRKRAIDRNRAGHFAVPRCVDRSQRYHASAIVTSAAGARLHAKCLWLGRHQLDFLRSNRHGFYFGSAVAHPELYIQSSRRLNWSPPCVHS